jgi:hypothetical protein
MNQSETVTQPKTTLVEEIRWDLLLNPPIKDPQKSGSATNRGTWRRLHKSKKKIYI